MINENEVCDEVLALLERMDMFPEQFISAEQFQYRWGRILDPDFLQAKYSPFTKREQKLLRDKAQEVRRAALKRYILANMMGVEEVEEVGYPTETNPSLTTWETPDPEAPTYTKVVYRTMEGI